MTSFFTFKPFPDEADDPLGDFRDLCREVFPPSPHAVLRRVTAVGALHDPQKGLRGGDPFYFEKAILQCASEGLPIAPDFELTPINLLRGPEQDFIAPDFRIDADLLMFCAIYEPGTPLFRSHPLTQKLLAECPVSLHHLDSGAWRRAALRCGPLAIFTVGDVAEINAGHFVCAEYPQIRLGPESHIRLTMDHALLVQRDLAEKTGLRMIEPETEAPRIVRQEGNAHKPIEPIEPLGWFEEKLLGLALHILESKPLRKNLLNRFDPKA